MKTLSLNTMKIHELKTWPIYFQAITRGEKTFELRKNDRDFAVGDVLILNEYDPDKDALTGAVQVAKVTYILSGFGLEEGFVAMGIVNAKFELA